MVQYYDAIDIINYCYWSPFCMLLRGSWPWLGTAPTCDQPPCPRTSWLFWGILFCFLLHHPVDFVPKSHPNAKQHFCYLCCPATCHFQSTHLPQMPSSASVASGVQPPAISIVIVWIWRVTWNPNNTSLNPGITCFDPHQYVGWMNLGSTLIHEKRGWVRMLVTRVQPWV